MTERISAWRCIGCGRIEGPQPCVGICEDRRTDLVLAADYDTLLEELAHVRHERAALTLLVRQIAHTTPRNGMWERTWLALQARARQVLGETGDGEQVSRHDRRVGSHGRLRP